MRRARISLLLAALVLPTSAVAVTLQDLQLGGSFTSSGGELTFDFAPGSIALSGALPLDLSQYEVTPTATGFFVSGPLTAVGAAFAGLTLAYRVSAAPGLALASASLLTNGMGFGEGAFAMATSGFSNGAELAVLLSQEGATGTVSEASFVATSVLEALASLELVGMTPGDVAGFGAVQHGFSFIPLYEPATALLLMAGLGGLGWLGRRRAGSRASG